MLNAQDTIKHSFCKTQYKNGDTTITIERTWFEVGWNMGGSFNMYPQSSTSPVGLSLGGHIRRFYPQTEKWAIGMNIGLEGNNLIDFEDLIQNSFRIGCDFAAMFRPKSTFSMVYGIGLNEGFIQGISCEQTYLANEKIQSYSTYGAGEIGLDMFVEFRWHPSKSRTLGFSLGYFNNLMPSGVMSMADRGDLLPPVHHYTIQIVYALNVDEMFKSTKKGKSLFAKIETEQIQ